MSDNKKRKRNSDTSSKSNKKQKVGDNNASNEDKKELAKGARYHCNYCTKDITNEVRIKCAQCTDFDLCVDCFFVGVETGNHKSDHSYRVIDDMSAPLYSKSWGAEEELLLLEGIEMFGLGNWADIAEHVGTKHQVECEYHYWNTYIDVPTYPLPDPSRGLVDDTNIKYDQLVKDDQGMLVYKNTLPKYKHKYHRDPSLGIEVGFIPLRGDFDYEYENEKEVLIAEMDINDDDPPEVKDIKIGMILGYDFILRERERRKKFILERNLLDWKKVQAIEKKRSKEQKEIVDKYRPFARFVSQTQFTEFMQAILTEHEIIQRINQLKEYRKMGITTLGDAELYEQEKKRREEGRRGSYSYPIGSRYRNKSRSSSFDSLGSLRKTSIPTTTSGPLELAGLPGVELLTLKERELCSQLRISPKQYLVIKDTFIRESFRLGCLRKTTAFKLVNMDILKVGRLYEFFSEAGWIKS